MERMPLNGNCAGQKLDVLFIQTDARLSTCNKRNVEEKSAQKASSGSPILIFMRLKNNSNYYVN